ncbi:DUF6584 family protein [Actinoplanes derwentensis]|uniref:Uncharacterized protein n=1 Tax=Actinoplanes derwentensis TaxID=113562 RepID=A0A1H1PPP8_9ACTN|nr:DUF6584 family protein [Actinoplanes derwentensis]GID88391.1 hypothetical protein Ade03nite_73150 [Actinoplanes derwentensis]SDS13063.1 hypothetical protein SAMN04489716_0080 [Actinoplanes derwentensis]
MGKPEVLARVDADLDRGHTHLAAQRLNSLIAGDPFDLSLRIRLRDVHRRTGNHAQAGRWGYLTEDVTPAELGAFAKAYYRSDADQLRALGLRGDRPRGLGPLAEGRLAALTDGPRPSAAVPDPPGPAPYPVPQAAATRRTASPAPDILASDFAGAIILLLVAILTGIGVVTVISWFL